MSDTANYNGDVTPDSLMDSFKGKGIKPILIFTLVVHVVLIIGSSVPFLVGKVLTVNQKELTEEERTKIAVEDATKSLRKIAKKHGLNPTDISSQFGGGGSRTTKAADETPTSEAPAEATGTDGAATDTEREPSDYEKNLNTSAQGPSAPVFEEDKDDIF